MAGIIDINSVRKGNKLDIDGEPYLVVGVDFRKPGKGTPSTEALPRKISEKDSPTTARMPSRASP